MNIPLGIAPCSWGIEDIMNEKNPPWQKVIKEASLTGFKSIELGPYGYFPTEASKLKGILLDHNLTLSAGTLYDNLSHSASIDYLVEKTRKICSLISQINQENAFLVVIDSVKEDRNFTAGHKDIAKRLSKNNWDILIDNIKTVSKVARDEYGIRAVVHPHAGGYIEFSDETEKLINDIDNSIAGLCLDTGHLYYAGDDPVDSIKHFKERIDYIHFKDINKKVYIDSIEKNIGFFDACNNQVMCSIGKGCLDYNQIIQALNEINYVNCITIEQERDPQDNQNILEDLVQSFIYLNRF